MADYSPYMQPGHEVSYTASAALTGGQLVEVSGNQSVQPAGAASAKVVGVALYDVPNVGDLATVQSAGIQRLTAASAVAAGDAVAAAAGGQIATAGTNPIVGIAITAAAAGAVALVKLNR